MKANDTRNGMKKARKMIAMSVTLPIQLLGAIDARARSLDLTRSQYLRRLAKNDLGGKAA